MNRDACNGFRYDGSERGHYESYFQRANHPSRPLAFWIRYTLFSPRNRARDAVGELWAVYFDGERHAVTAVKEVLPLSRCEFSPRSLKVRLGDATLDDRAVVGKASALGQSIEWRLDYDSPSPPLLLLQERFYDAAFPKAKALVGSPLARFRGTVTVNGTVVAIEDWVGSQNHNWGSQHTDRYAWGQVAGFDDAPSTFLEVATARVRIGPSWSPVLTPWMTTAVLRHEGRDYVFNNIAAAIRAKARYDFFDWTFATTASEATLEGRIDGAAVDFIGLPYDNPPGGRKTCLNIKIARADVTLRRHGEKPLVLTTKNRAAFEILTDRQDHGVAMLEV